MEETLLTRFLLGLLVLLVIGLPAAAQEWPDKPVKIVLGVPPGGGLDVLARGLAAELSAKWGKAVVVDNKPGASGMIAAEGIAHSPPDGYALLAFLEVVGFVARLI